MSAPTLCIIQARYASTRLPAKMLQTLGDETLIARGYRLACEAFGAENVVVACCSVDKCTPLADELARIGATVNWYNGAESDVLGRFHEAAHARRWHGDSVIFRWTPDDPWKDPASCRRVAAGERLPVEIGGEAFSLRALDEAHKNERREAYVDLDCRLVRDSSGEARACKCGRELLRFYTADGDACGHFNVKREHITRALFSVAPPPAPLGQCWTVDTADDLAAARARLEDEIVRLEEESWALYTRCAQ